MAVAVKMCHLLSAACQDVSSLGRWPVTTLPLSLLRRKRDPRSTLRRAHAAMRAPLSRDLAGNFKLML